MLCHIVTLNPKPCKFTKLNFTLGNKNLLILQLFHHFTYVTAHSPPLPSLYLHHSSFSNPSVASPTSQFISQPFLCFTYVKLILQSFFCFSYIIGSSLTSLSELPMFTADHPLTQPCVRNNVDILLIIEVFLKCHIFLDDHFQFH